MYNNVFKDHYRNSTSIRISFLESREQADVVRFEDAKTAIEHVTDILFTCKSQNSIKPTVLEFKAKL